MPGYHEGMAEHPELHHAYGFPTNLELQRSLGVVGLENQARV